jgi:hypothetical protein
MALIQPRQARYSIVPIGGEIKLRIPGRRNWFLTLFLGVWLCGWGGGEVAALIALIKGGRSATETMFILVWLVFWTFGGLVAFLSLVVALGGEEEVVLRQSPPRIKVRDAIIPFKWNEYDATSIRRMRYLPQTPLDTFSRGFMPWRFPNIAFDYGMSTVRFGSNLEEPEAYAIIREITKALPMLAETAEIR